MAKKAVLKDAAKVCLNLTKEMNDWLEKRMVIEQRNKSNMVEYALWQYRNSCSQDAVILTPEEKAEICN